MTGREKQSCTFWLWASVKQTPVTMKNTDSLLLALINFIFHITRMWVVMMHEDVSSFHKDTTTCKLVSNLCVKHCRSEQQLNPLWLLNSNSKRYEAIFPWCILLIWQHLNVLWLMWSERKMLKLECLLWVTVWLADPRLEKWSGKYSGSPALKFGFMMGKVFVSKCKTWPVQDLV